MAEVGDIALFTNTQSELTGNREIFPKYGEAVILLGKVIDKGGPFGLSVQVIAPASFKQKWPSVGYDSLVEVAPADGPARELSYDEWYAIARRAGAIASDGAEAVAEDI